MPVSFKIQEHVMELMNGLYFSYAKIYTYTVFHSKIQIIFGTVYVFRSELFSTIQTRFLVNTYQLNKFTHFHTGKRQHKKLKKDQEEKR